MPSYSTSSFERLMTCDPQLQKLFLRVIENRDCTILCGHRTKEEQDKAVAEGKSRAEWPHSRHNMQPSRAVDVMPYPIDWNNMRGLREFSEYVKGVADGMGIKVRWGGDFKSFFDGPHWELL